MRGGIVTIGVIGALLCACTSGQATPVPTSSASVTPSTPVTSTSSHASPASSSPTGPLTTGPNVQPGEKPPVLDSVAKQRTADGAQAFAVYYYKALDWSIATNNAFLLNQIVSPTCKGCLRLIQNIDGLQSKHQILRGGRISIKSVQIDHDKFAFEADYVVKIVANQEAVTIAQNQRVSTSAPLSDDDSLVYLRWQRTAWQVAEVTNT